MSFFMYSKPYNKYANNDKIQQYFNIFLNSIKASNYHIQNYKLDRNVYLVFG